jgi:hypothetical protein
MIQYQTSPVSGIRHWIIKKLHQGSTIPGHTRLLLAEEYKNRCLVQKQFIIIVLASKDINIEKKTCNVMAFFYKFKLSYHFSNNLRKSVHVCSFATMSILKIHWQYGLLLPI